MPEQHTILGGKVYVYKRPNSSVWQCSKLFRGQKWPDEHEGRERLQAKEIAEDWYRQLRGKLRAGEIRNEKTFREVSDHRSGKAIVLMYRQDRWEHYDFNDIQP